MHFNRFAVAFLKLVNYKQLENSSRERKSYQYQPSKPKDPEVMRERKLRTNTKGCGFFVFLTACVFFWFEI